MKISDELVIRIGAHHLKTDCFRWPNGTLPAELHIRLSILNFATHCQEWQDFSRISVFHESESWSCQIWQLSATRPGIYPV